MHMRAGTKMGDVTLTDTMLKDGLVDAFHNYHMGITGKQRRKSVKKTKQLKNFLKRLYIHYFLRSICHWWRPLKGKYREDHRVH